MMKRFVSMIALALLATSVKAQVRGDDEKVRKYDSPCAAGYKCQGAGQGCL